MKAKSILTLLGMAALLVGWGVTWANQNARIVANAKCIEDLSGKVANVTSQATESDRAIVDEIKAELKGRD